MRAGPSATGYGTKRRKLGVERRTSEGKSKREIIRCLKRYVAREIYAALTQTGDQKLARAT
jgi:transposase